MSMLSSQIDALRRAAQNYRDFGKYEAEQMMLDAADTIWRLRDDLQRANAENAKLREDFNKMDVWYSKELNAYVSENAKLRELCASLYEFAMSEYPDGTELNFADRMRELGIEVEE